MQPDWLASCVLFTLLLPAFVRPSPGQRHLDCYRYGAQIIPMCSGNGDVQLPFGSPQYLAIGALVLLVWVFVEIFGSPFFRNIEVSTSCCISASTHLSSHQHFLSSRLVAMSGQLTAVAASRCLCAPS